MAKLSAILDQVDAGTVLLPEFQRGYVWNRDQVRGLMRSLYKGYPAGSLLVWETDAAHQAVRGVAPAGGTRSLLLDGQQRVTTLYGIVRGTPPAFFEGDPETGSTRRWGRGAAGGPGTPRRAPASPRSPARAGTPRP